MRVLGKSIVAMFAIIGVFASIQQLRGQDVSPLAGATLAHIGIVTKDVDKTVRMFETTFGITVPAAVEVGPIPLPGDAPGGAKYKVRFTTARVGDVNIELIQPTVGEGPHKDHLDRFGTGLQHIAFTVKDPAAAIKSVQGMGGKLTMNNYVDMKDTMGFVFEISGPPRPPRAQ